MDNNEQPPHNNHGGSLHLPLFWAENSEAWFGIAKSRFRLRNIEDEQVKFDLVVNALPKECLRTVLDLVTNPPDAYEAIKERLSEHHNLTEFQRVEKIHAMEALGGRKPSELLHEMLELCPTGHEASPFFLFLFLQRLPSFLSIMLGEDDYEDIRAVAVKADKLWAIHAHQQHGTVAAVESAPVEPAAIAAVKGGFSKPRGGGSSRSRGRGKAASGSSKQPAALNPAASPFVPPPSSLSRVQSGLCFYHWNYGDKASKCDGLCSWAGN
jgi:hypothetical protein